jgi:hypothetical protein
MLPAKPLTFRTCCRVVDFPGPSGKTMQTELNARPQGRESAKEGKGSRLLNQCPPFDSPDWHLQTPLWLLRLLLQTAVVASAFQATCCNYCTDEDAENFAIYLFGFVWMHKRAGVKRHSRAGGQCGIQAGFAGTANKSGMSPSGMVG